MNFYSFKNASINKVFTETCITYFDLVAETCPFYILATILRLDGGIPYNAHVAQIHPLLYVCLFFIFMPILG